MNCRISERERGMHSHRARAMLILTGATLIALLLTACGGGGDNLGATTGTPTSQSTVATQAESPTPTPTTAGNRKVELVKQGYTETVTSTPAGDFASFNCGILVHNLDQTEAAGQVDWTVNFYDATGAKVAGSYGYERNLFPDETRGVGD